MKTKLMMLVILSVLCGCQNINNKEATNEEKNSNLISVKNSTIKEVDEKTGQQEAKHLESLASSIPNVNDTTAVVLGKYAIVGIDVDQNLDRSEVGSIKYTVSESLKNDPSGKNAVVVADPDIYARLKEISQDIKDGKPVQGIMNELADISGRLMPEIPSDMVNPTPKNATEDPKKQLNSEEKQNLEDTQEEQSNHHK